MTESSNGTGRADVAAETVTRLLTLSGFEPSLKTTENEERIGISIELGADDIPTIVGPQGQTLAAYQLLANRILSREDGEGKPISLDVSGYGVLREQRLEKLAHRLGDVASGKGVEIRLYGMNPRDRRSMHMGLQSLDAVQTFSEDEGIARRLVITRR